MIKVIGIDPDLRNPGLCKWSDDGWSFIKEPKYTLAMVINDIPTWVHQRFVFAIEDVNKTKAVFNRDNVDNDKKKSRISQNVGMVKGVATLLQDYIEYHGGTVLLVPAGVGKQLKRDAKLFNQVTGYTGRTNEDMRDAYCIAHWGYNKLKSEK